MMLGIIDEPLTFLLYNPFAVVVVMTYFSLPFAVITIYASLEKMDWALVDAASDLGAGPARAFCFITLPQTLPGVISAAILTFVPLMGMFFVPLLVGNPSSAMIAPLIANLMQAFQLGLGAALSFIVALVVMAIIALAWRYINLDGARTS
jgi:spermidine/putrescine transport system permease protein